MRDLGGLEWACCFCDASHITILHRSHDLNTVSQWITRYHTVSQSITRYHVVLRSITMNHKVSHSVTKYHKVSRSITQCHNESQGITQYRKVSQGITKYRKMSHGVTRYHTVSQGTGYYKKRLVYFRGHFCKKASQCRRSVHRIKSNLRLYVVGNFVDWAAYWCEPACTGGWQDLPSSFQIQRTCICQNKSYVYACH